MECEIVFISESEIPFNTGPSVESVLVTLPVGTLVHSYYLFLHVRRKLRILVHSWMTPYSEIFLSTASKDRHIDDPPTSIIKHTTMVKYDTDHIATTPQNDNTTDNQPTIETKMMVPHHYRYTRRNLLGHSVSHDWDIWNLESVHVSK
jgi:hypothetical protein